MANIPQPVFTQGRNDRPSLIEQLLLRAVSVAPQAFFQFQDLQDRREDRAMAQADRQTQGQVSAALLGGGTQEEILRRLGATGGEQVASQTFTPTAPQTSAPAGAALAGPDAITLGGGTTPLNTSTIDPAAAAVALPLLQQREIFEEQRGAARAERELAQNRDTRDQQRLELDREQGVFDREMSTKMFGLREREVNASIAAAQTERAIALQSGQLDIARLGLQSLQIANDMFDAQQTRADQFSGLLVQLGVPPNQARETAERSILNGLSREDYITRVGTTLQGAAVDGDYAGAAARAFTEIHGTDDPIAAVAEGFGLNAPAVANIDAVWQESGGRVETFISTLRGQLEDNRLLPEREREDILQAALAIAALRDPQGAAKIKLDKTPSLASRFLRFITRPRGVPSIGDGSPINPPR